jgi:hypothetical protein
MVEGGTYREHQEQIRATEDKLADYLASEENPEEYGIRRLAFTNAVGRMDAEYGEANTGAAVSGPSTIQEVRHGMLLAFNDHYRGTVPGYMQVEATLGAAIEEVTDEVAGHPGITTEPEVAERVLFVLKEASNKVYSRPGPQTELGRQAEPPPQLPIPHP